MLAVWWVWIYTTWALNWLDPETLPVRLMLYVSMLLGLFMSMSIPEAFGARGLSFALAFAAMQVGRTLFVRLVPRRRSRRPVPQLPAHRDLAQRLGGILGARRAGGGRGAAGALGRSRSAIEYLGPWAAFWVPGMGRSATADWDVRGEHIAERCGLFVIICLGETLLISGATFAEADVDRAGLAAFVVNFLGTVAMWWLYFHIGQERAAHVDRALRGSGPRRAGRLHLRPYPDRGRDRGQRGRRPSW